MRNENGKSRGFGFVSHQTHEASAALHAMNGCSWGRNRLQFDCTSRAARKAHATIWWTQRLSEEPEWCNESHGEQR
ncbi:hypothetical protein K438DRAFT_2019576, partial [Mycena galopus ATCC 62051]